MKTALIGGRSPSSSRCAPTSTMLSVRVPGGASSGRCSRRGVLGNAYPAPLISPPPGTPNFPASAGSAKIARIPLPPFWLRSSPFPTLIAAGVSAAYHSASVRIWPSGTPQMRAASAPLYRRARAIYSATPATWRASNAWAAGEGRVRAGVVQRQDGLRPVGGDDRREARVDRVERLLPRDPLEPRLAAAADAAQRRPDPALAVDEARVRGGYLGAEDAGRVGVGVRAAERDDALVRDADREAARVGTVQGADAVPLGDHGKHYASGRGREEGPITVPPRQPSPRRTRSPAAPTRRASAVSCCLLLSVGLPPVDQGACASITRSEVATF